MWKMAVSRSRSCDLLVVPIQLLCAAMVHAGDQLPVQDTVLASTAVVKTIRLRDLYGVMLSHLRDHNRAKLTRKTGRTIPNSTTLLCPTFTMLQISSDGCAPGVPMDRAWRFNDDIDARQLAARTCAVTRRGLCSRWIRREPWRKLERRAVGVRADEGHLPLRGLMSVHPKGQVGRRGWSFSGGRHRLQASRHAATFHTHGRSSPRAF